MVIVMLWIELLLLWNLQSELYKVLQIIVTKIFRNEGKFCLLIFKGCDLRF